MGSALHVSLPKGLQSATPIDVTIFYKTTKACTALQWLEKEYFKFITRYLVDSHPPGRHRENAFRIFSASVSPSMHALLRRYKVIYGVFRI
jgi:hypothetical protein